MQKDYSTKFLLNGLEFILSRVGNKLTVACPERGMVKEYPHEVDWGITENDKQKVASDKVLVKRWIRQEPEWDLPIVTVELKKIEVETITTITKRVKLQSLLYSFIESFDLAMYDVALAYFVEEQYKVWNNYLMDWHNHINDLREKYTEQEMVNLRMMLGQFLDYLREELDKGEATTYQFMLEDK